jgi:hypothetical protein
MDALASALGAAMTEAVRAVADRVVARLERERADEQAKADAAPAQSPSR